MPRSFTNMAAAGSAGAILLLMPIHWCSGRNSSGIPYKYPWIVGWCCANVSRCISINWRHGAMRDNICQPNSSWYRRTLVSCHWLDYHEGLWLWSWSDYFSNMFPIIPYSMCVQRNAETQTLIQKFWKIDSFFIDIDPLSDSNTWKLKK